MYPIARLLEEDISDIITIFSLSHCLYPTPQPLRGDQLFRRLQKYVRYKTRQFPLPQDFKYEGGTYHDASGKST